MSIGEDGSLWIINEHHLPELHIDCRGEAFSLDIRPGKEIPSTHALGHVECEDEQYLKLSEEER